MMTYCQRTRNPKPELGTTRNTYTRSAPSPPQTYEELLQYHMPVPIADDNSRDSALDVIEVASAFSPWVNIWNYANHLIRRTSDSPIAHLRFLPSTINNQQSTIDNHSNSEKEVSRSGAEAQSL